MSLTLSVKVYDLDFTDSFDPSTPIQDFLSQALRRLEAVPPKRFQVKYNDQVLQDGTLESNGVVDGAHIEVN